ncbi:hypothetical protein A6V39_00025 [Candidatus Mycoplasma haematobovis]|uniref:Uncharacterized protein n=1 Tax=Candidatus Mycoplasma haematobovis TaxID=432608 RepID=A0A1A9QEQ0_9MOLU|nr:hypothetical protein [Candidatus Mycoplasma haematobovis]OAL10435.1 hypothetical protein A6V39_00025 [Candidatus Mycoplasma haematobovis]
MDPKQLLLIGAGTAVVGGGATSAYFLIPERKEATVESQSSGEVVKNTTSLRATLTGVEFLNTKDDTHKTAWGKLVDKFHELGEAGTIKISASIAPKSSNPDNKDSNIKILKDACDALLAMTEFQDGDKDIAKNWCSTTSPLLAEARPNPASIGS